MNFFIFILFVAVAVIVIKKFGWAVFGGDSGEEKHPYFKKNYLLTKAESSFFRVLERAVENRYYIFPQVHLSELLYVKTGRQDYYRYLNKINRKSVDFVIADKNYLSPLLAIELDDASHYRNDRRDRDDFVEDVCKNAGLHLLRVRNSYSYDVPKLKVLIEELILGKKESGAPIQTGSNIVP